MENKLNNMTFRGMITIIAVIALVAFAIDGLIKPSEAKEVTKLSSVTNLMTEEWQEVVIIKGERVVYTGSPKSIDDKLQGLEVQEIANCEDEFAITIFVK